MFPKVDETKYLDVTWLQPSSDQLMKELLDDEYFVYLLKLTKE